MFAYDVSATWSWGIVSASSTVGWLWPGVVLMLRVGPVFDFGSPYIMNINEPSMTFPKPTPTHPRADEVSRVVWNVIYASSSPVVAFLYDSKAKQKL